MNGKITFVGAGPGAVDLITLRGAAALDEAELVVYAGSLVNEKLLERAAKAELVNSAKLSLPEVIEIMAAACRAGKRVVRLHTGDPAIYGAVSEQFRELDKLGIPYEVVPGVSSAFAAAAELKVELTMPELSQSVILTRMAGRTPVPEKEALEPPRGTWRDALHLPERRRSGRAGRKARFRRAAAGDSGGCRLPCELAEPEDRARYAERYRRPGPGGRHQAPGDDRGRPCARPRRRAVEAL